jgi:hypothetical protein
VIVRPAPPVIVHPQPPVLTFSGRFEDIDVFFSGYSQSDIRAECMAYIGSSHAFDWVDDIVIDGRAYHRTFGWWSPSALCVIAANNTVDPWASLIAEGTIEGTPFLFTGDSTSEIRSQCESFIYGALDDEWLDDLTVNGVHRHNSSGWWDAPDVCMIVASNADYL